MSLRNTPVVLFLIGAAAGISLIECDWGRTNPVDHIGDSKGDFGIAVWPEDTTITAGDSLTLVVIPDSGYAVTQYCWDIDGEERITPVNYITLLFADSGAHEVRVVVEDSAGMLSDAELISVAVSAPAATTECSATPWNPRDAGELEHQGKMVKIKAKGYSFCMGAVNSRPEEGPVHAVRFTYDFWMDTAEVTQREYSDVMRATYEGYRDPDWSSHGTGDNYPAYYVNIYDAALYCNARTKVAGSIDTAYGYTSITGTPGDGCRLQGLRIDLDASGYRLPNEAEWEYACRGGTTSEYFWGDAVDESTIRRYAWYGGENAGDGYWAGAYETLGGTRPVAQRLPNDYGLYDINGNVWEWCNDFYWEYGSVSQTDPVGVAEDLNRILRGGGWYSNHSYLRCSFRAIYYPHYAYHSFGIRAVRRAQENPGSP